ncbi:glycoside hydrolase family 3 C-terminal domain-containing protein [Aquimarina sp. ERC-38]|uniref:glycoside hydrolase family 3 C-terminal domain-containing protein n=1 Tax=Aquimarina sp. ERC-38 TaxID=2949996 RepID=UPI002247BD77|nr:glycoside hydrolase family 3 C-terminal domain-containing protein [Aquimarina sp. ERC-38]UZO82292.1 glycoside hydrolase family 3 C-terminal domain-containing protein [Aquimarina sp. ERC-38]
MLKTDSKIDHKLVTINSNRLPVRSVILLFFIHIVTCFSQKVDLSFQDASLPVDTRIELLVSQMTVEEKINQLTNGAPAIPRLQVPDYDWWSEALHGVARNGKATIFPQAIGLGATFDPDLVQKVANAISTEARAKYAISQEMGNHSKFAGLTFWSPTVNLFRDPRYGRGQECYGEDPYLLSKIGVAFVKGLQGDNPDKLKVAACAKHFALHSGPEHDKLKFNVSPSKQDLYETYFPAFKALVTEAKVEGVMMSYNMVYEKPAVLNSFLIQEILRDTWNFDGYITSDCGAISGISGKDGFVSTPVEAAAMALKAGTNLNCGQAYKLLTKALEKELVTEELIHERTKQLFKTRFRLGMFDSPDTSSYKTISSDHIHSTEHIELAREAAQKSIVLLKNKNNVLPISKDIKVPYLTGPFANSNDMLMGSYYGVSSNVVSILEGVTDAISLGTSLNYRSGALPFHKNINEKNWAPNVAKESDIVICVVGLTADREGEGVDAIASDHGGDRKDLKLPENQINYIHQLVEKKKGPLILVVASGSPISLEGIEEHCDAILQIWYPGEQGGNAVADVLFGKISPSGHLPITFPKNVEQLPPYDDYSMKGRTYKYMTKEPMFPFGFGLTYSKTKFSDLLVNKTTLKSKNSLEVELKVANTGDFDIEEVVQLYVSPENTSENLPIHSLKAFERVQLKKGETKTINLSLTPEELKVIDKNGEKTWLKGNYKISVGNASPGPLSKKLGATVPLETTITLR